MERRKFLTRAGAGAALGLTAACSSRQSALEGAPAVQTSPEVTWRLASSFPRSLDTIFGAAEVMAERVSQLTEGRFTIHVYPGGELLPALQVLDAVQKSTVQIGHTVSYYYKGKNPSLCFDSAVPFGLTARQQNSWLYYGGGLEAMRKIYADFGIINFPGGNTGIQMGGWFRNEIGSLADINNLKMRIPGLGGEIMNAMGATVQQLAGGDIYPALERGAIDATEWVGPHDDEKLGFYKVAKYYYYPGWWEPGPTVSFLINREAWDKLPVRYQQAIEVASAEVNLSMLAEYDARNAPALARLLDKGVQLRPFPDDVMREAKRLTDELMDSMAADDAGYREVYDAWKKFRAESTRWFASAETTYAAFAFQ